VGLVFPHIERPQVAGRNVDSLQQRWLALKYVEQGVVDKRKEVVLKLMVLSEVLKN
jgi:hypothetical protein